MKWIWVFFLGCAWSPYAFAGELDDLWQDVLENRRQCYSNAELRVLRDELSTKREVMDDLRASLDLDEDRIEAEKVSLNQERAEVEKKLEELAQKVSWQREAAEADIQTLARLYEAMEAKAAAQTLSGLAPIFVAGLIAEMKTENAAKILRHVPASQMRQYTLALATRNVLTQ